MVEFETQKGDRLNELDMLVAEPILVGHTLVRAFNRPKTKQAALAVMKRHPSLLPKVVEYCNYTGGFDKESGCWRMCVALKVRIMSVGKDTFVAVLPEEL